MHRSLLKSFSTFNYKGGKAHFAGTISRLVRGLRDPSLTELFGQVLEVIFHYTVLQNKI